MNLSGFKAYDIRGRYPSTLNEELARNIGYAFAQEFQPKRVVIGHDARLSGPALYAALAEGFRAAVKGRFPSVRWSRANHRVGKGGGESLDFRRTCSAATSCVISKNSVPNPWGHPRIEE